MYYDDTEDPQEQQIVNGFRIPIPKVGMDALSGPLGRATNSAAPIAAPPTMPVRTASNPTPAASTPVQPAPNPGMNIPGVTPNPNGDDMIKDVMRRSATRMPPTPPIDNSMPALINRRAQLATPTDRNAVGPDGKPMYKLGIGGKILGSLANFASGMNRGGVVVDTSSGATNRKYDIAEQNRMANLAGTDKQIEQQKDLNEENRKMFDSAQKQAYESSMNNARQDVADARQQTADAQRLRAEADARLKDSKLNPIDQRIKEADQMKLAGNDRKYYIANGKLPEGKELTPYQQEQLKLERDKFEYEKNKDKNKPAGTGGGRGGSGTPTFKDSASVDKYSNDFYAKARKAVDQEKKNWKALNRDATPEEEQAAYNAIESEYQKRADQFEEEKKGYYANLPGGGGAPAAQKPAAPAESSAIPKAQGANKTYKFNYKSKDGKVKIGSDDGRTWYDRATGKPYYGS